MARDPLPLILSRLRLQGYARPAETLARVLRKVKAGAYMTPHEREVFGAYMKIANDVFKVPR